MSPEQEEAWGRAPEGARAVVELLRAYPSSEAVLSRPEPALDALVQVDILTRRGHPGGAVGYMAAMPAANGGNHDGRAD